jgi:peptide deformylase
MKKNRIYKIINLMAVVLTIVLAGSAFAGGSTGKNSPPQSKNYETIEGVLSIKEGHGDFLVRLSNGRVQRFSVQGNAAEITRNGKPARYIDLKRSDSIQVKYNATNRKVIAIHAGGS